MFRSETIAKVLERERAIDAEPIHERRLNGRLNEDCLKEQRRGLPFENPVSLQESCLGRAKRHTLRSSWQPGSHYHQLDRQFRRRSASPMSFCSGAQASAAAFSSALIV